MGMYTELIFGARISKNIPTKELNVLKWLFTKSDQLHYTGELPEHEFFKCDRWEYITSCSSYYFAVLDTHRTFRYDDIAEEYVLSSRANLKNYSNEIEKFLNWIKPYITAGSGIKEFYAVVCYEEQSEPTIYYLKDNEQ